MRSMNGLSPCSKSEVLNAETFWSYDALFDLGAKSLQPFA